MKKILTICLSLSCIYAYAQNYNVNLIPETLLKGANAVKRFEELKVTLVSPSKARVKHTYAITILNEAGKHHTGFSSSYDKLHSIDDITGKLFDATGKEIKKVKQKEISDVSYDDEMSLMTDTRLKRHSFYYNQYPYTIEYEEENTLDGIFFLPSWVPVSDDLFAVQQSRYVVEFPADYKLRYKQFNYDGQPVSGGNDKVKSFTWSIKDFAPIKYDAFFPPWQEITPSVRIAPSDFEVGGYKGNMDSWKNLGIFINKLNEGKDELPENIKLQVHQMVDGITDKEEKIKKLYEFMQQNTRYISIQMGIGSWQPFDAKYVAGKKYGDCKALSNYMKSLLTEAGIEANYVLVKAGEGLKGLFEDFPAPNFNHAIMCVPDGKDTLWLECTSQTASAGFMGGFTGNRQALMIGKGGGYVVQTPRYTALDNQQIRKVDATIDAEGNMLADVRTTFSGLQQDTQHSLMYEANKEQREKYLNRNISLATYTVDKNDYNETKGRKPVIVEKLHITAPHFASITGKRMFIAPNMFNKSSSKLVNDEPRKYEIHLGFEFIDVDTIQISIPGGYEAEAIPANVNVKNKFGNFSVDYSVKGNQIMVVRKYETLGNRYPASDYKELVEFFDVKYKADRAKVVLVKKD